MYRSVVVLVGICSYLNIVRIESYGTGAQRFSLRFSNKQRAGNTYMISELKNHCTQPMQNILLFKLFLNVFSGRISLAIGLQRGGIQTDQIPLNFRK